MAHGSRVRTLHAFRGGLADLDDLKERASQRRPDTLSRFFDRLPIAMTIVEDKDCFARKPRFDALKQVIA